MYYNFNTNLETPEKPLKSTRLIFDSVFQLFSGPHLCTGSITLPPPVDKPPTSLCEVPSAIFQIENFRNIFSIFFIFGNFSSKTLIFEQYDDPDLNDSDSSLDQLLMS